MVKCLYRRAESKLSVQRFDLRIAQVLTKQVAANDTVSFNISKKFLQDSFHCFTIVRKAGQPADSVDEMTPLASANKPLLIR